MIVVRITINVVSEKRKELVQTLLSMIEPTGKEPGCLSYDVFCDIEDKNRFILLEEWKTREDLDDHLRSHRFSVLLGSTPLLCEPPKTQIDTVSQSEGREAIDAARDKKS